MTASTNNNQIVCLLDVLGFENLLKTNGLQEIHEKYTRLIDYVKKQKGGIDVVPTPDGHVAVGWLVIGNAYFSDSLPTLLGITRILQFNDNVMSRELGIGLVKILKRFG
jgi:hypothetical protein